MQLSTAQTILAVSKISSILPMWKAANPSKKETLLLSTASRSHSRSTCPDLGHAARGGVTSHSKSSLVSISIDIRLLRSLYGVLVSHIQDVEDLHNLGESGFVGMFSCATDEQQTLGLKTKPGLIWNI